MARAVYPVASSTGRRRRHNSARPIVDSVHLPAAPQTTYTFRAGERVGVQLREYIWVPGTIISADYHMHYGSIVYMIEYFAADGCKRTEGFFPKDVRSDD